LIGVLNGLYVEGFPELSKPLISMLCPSGRMALTFQKISSTFTISSVSVLLVLSFEGLLLQAVNKNKNPRINKL